MKKIPILLATALAMVFYASCSGDGDSPSSGNGNNGSQAAENGQVYDNNDTEKPYTGNAKIYMADKRDRNTGRPILTGETMLEIGTMSNGEITLDLPENVDSRYLREIDFAPKGLNVVPLGTEIWFYMDPLRLVNNGEHIGDLEYVKIVDQKEYHKISYWYFSQNTIVNGTVNEGENTLKYNINAEKGWNKVYLHINAIKEEVYVTTDLSKVPDGLMWLFF
ncbi:MAG: hypothetical protein LBQ87_08305 [Candidatus Fibromonas sp.]|jgi:hypothetical protein|nr:hypothetical protein [Candidatus Fibromonas sp.]